VLRYGLGGWPPPGPNHFLWRDGQLAYDLPAEDSSGGWPGGEKVARPTPGQWGQLWWVCDEVGVWSWPPIIGNVNVIDGLFYGLELRVGDRAVESFGQVEGAPAGFYEKLLRLHATFQAVVGWPPLE
jgi:hypothetical protein